MFGLHLFYIEVQTLELLLRRVYRAITHNFEAGKVYLRRVQDVEPAFTEREFNEALELQKREDIRSNKLQISISNDHIGISQSQDHNHNKSDEEDDPDKELFSGLMGGGSKDEAKIKERKREEKKKLVAHLTSTKQQIQPFIWSLSLVKQDPLKAMQNEEKKEKLVPQPLQPKDPDVKLQVKLNQYLKHGASNSESKTVAKKNRKTLKSVPIIPSVKHDKGLTLTARKIVKNPEGTRTKQNASPDLTEAMNGPKVEPFKLIDRSPLKQNFESKAELE